MKTCLSLPGNYEKRLVLDLTQNRKTLVLISVLSFVPALLLFIISPVPLRRLFEIPGVFLRILLIPAGLAGYIVLHELTHGFFIKLFSGESPRFGFSPAYAYAGSDAYFNKKDFIIIALSPIVIWGIVLALLCAIVPPEWFWVFYALQIMNISGAAGDLYVCFRFLSLPGDILIRDSGTVMTVYGPKEDTK